MCNRQRQASPRAQFRSSADIGRVKIGLDSLLRHIRHLTQLKGLALWETDLGGEALKHIANFRQLRWLDLGDTRISNAGLGILKGLTSPAELSLLNTEIGDLGI
jgi:hypothetical protein